ncbi:MAG: hypothetical protein H0W84_05680 [Bacteroidetes bacterium]|nr:hypothetical protein [Bacteroidota bacterium]
MPTIYGSRASGGNLSLIPTAHATKGKLFIGATSAYDDVNNRLGVNQATPTATLHIGGVSGASGGILLELLANSGAASSSYTSIDFKVPTTGLIGQFLPTASNYSNAGINLAANSVGLLAEATSGQLGLGAAGSSGFMTFTTGGYAVANERLRIQSTGGFTFPSTNTAAGTTGAQTINKISGTVNIAAAATSVVVTNSLVSTTSIVFAVVRTNDATALIKNVVPAAGSFTITLNAATTSETSIGFWVIN